MATRLRNKLTMVRDQVHEAYQNGATLRDIARVHGVSAGTVRNLLKEMGVEMRARGRRKKQDMADPRILVVDVESLHEKAQDTASEEAADVPQITHYEGGAF